MEIHLKILIIKVLVKSYNIILSVILFIVGLFITSKYPFVTRDKYQFVNLIPTNMNCLEIGPFNKPLLTGEKVKYFDVLDKEGLTERAMTSGLYTKFIPHIDFVSKNGDLSVINDRFEVVLSSHVIEHQPDLIYHLKCIEELLALSGRYFLIIPDRRFSFDYYIPESTLAQVVAANIEQRQKHTLNSVIEHRCLTTHNNPYLHLVGLHGKPLLSDSLKNRLHQSIDEYNNSYGYIDVHAWYFTPQSFKLLIAQLFDAGLIKLKIEKIYATVPGKLEFFAILSKIN